MLVILGDESTLHAQAIPDEILPEDHDSPTIAGQPGHRRFEDGDPEAAKIEAIELALTESKPFAAPDRDPRRDGVPGYDVAQSLVCDYRNRESSLSLLAAITREHEGF